ncbi:hypothetical protein ACO1O0_005243 [Amphichorda felina]
MKSSLFLAVTGAVLAMASPIARPLDKRAMATDWVVETVTVTVTAGKGAIFTEQTKTRRPQHKPKPTIAPAPPAPTTTSIPPPPPAPTSSAAPPPPPETTSEAAPEPTFAPVPEPEPTTSAAPKPTTSAAPAPEPEKPDVDLGDYQTRMLYQHNLHRANHSSPALAWDAELAQWAKNTAESCVFAHDMDQGTGGYGQNLASWGGSGDISDLMVETAASGVTNQWYNGEVNAWTYYGMDDPPAGADLMAWGHFTQLVWKSSEKLGCHTAKCAAGTVLGLESWYTVCNYGPPGNYGGQYGANVLEPRGDPTANV